MAKAATDTFANLAVITVTESAANTLTFKKLETGISLFEKLAWVIHRVEYFFDVNATQFNATGDALTIALTATDQIAALTATNQSCLDICEVLRLDWGTAATESTVLRPWVRDFTDLPGGGIIVPPNPLYLAAKGTSLVAASSTTARLYYTNYQLTPDQYWELVESRRIISST